MECTNLNFFNGSILCVLLDKVLDQDYEGLLTHSNLESNYSESDFALLITASIMRNR
jgi:hypothetical protein